MILMGPLQLGMFYEIKSKTKRLHPGNLLARLFFLQLNERQTPPEPRTTLHALVLTLFPPARFQVEDLCF